jgi:hypothetical protein
MIQAMLGESEVALSGSAGSKKVVVRRYATILDDQTALVMVLIADLEFVRSN